MLVLGTPKQEVYWSEADIHLDLIPLTEDMDQKFVNETLTEVRDEKGQLTDVRRDVVKYNQLVGQHCIKNWRGNIVNTDGKALPCRPDAVALFMTCGPARDFVMEQVKGLSLYIAKEVEVGKPGSAPLLSGTEA